MLAWEKIRLRADQYQKSQHDWSRQQAAATRSLPLERAVNLRHSLPLPWAIDWCVEGPDSPVYGVSNARPLRDGSVMARLNAAGDSVTYQKSAGANLALVDFFPGNVWTSDNSPDGPNGFDVKRILVFEFAENATESTSFVEDVISPDAITNPHRVTPYYTGMNAENEAEAQTLNCTFEQGLNGQITKAKMGGASTSKRWCTVYEVEWNCPVGRATLTGAEVKALFNAQAQRLIPNEVIDQATLDADPVLRAFFDPLDPSDSSSNTSAGEYVKRVRYLWECKSPYTFPATETAITANDLVAWKKVGPCRDYDLTTGVDQWDAMSGQIPLSSTIGTYTPFVAQNDPCGKLFGYRVTQGIGSNNRRPLRCDAPSFRCSVQGSRANVYGMLPHNGANYEDDDEFQVFWLDTTGYVSEDLPAQWRGPRALENGSDSDYNNSGPAGGSEAAAETSLDAAAGRLFYDLGGDIELRSYYACVSHSHSNRMSGQQGLAGALRTRAYLGQLSNDSVFLQQFSSNLSRSIQDVITIENWSAMAEASGTTFIPTVVGDALNGTISFAHGAGDLPTGVITAVEINGTDVLVDSGATTADADISYAFGNFGAGGKLNKMPWGKAVTFKVKWAGGESLSGAITMPIPNTAADQYGLSRFASADANAKSTWSLLDAAGHSVAVNDPFYVRSTNEVLRLTTGGMPEPQSEATRGEVITWSVARQEWSPIELWTHQENVDTDAPVVAAPLPDVSRTSGVAFSLPAPDMTDAVDPELVYSFTIDNAPPSASWSIDAVTGVVSYSGAPALPASPIAVQVTGTDDAGNGVTDELILTITVDLVGEIVIKPDQTDLSENPYSNPSTKQEPLAQLKSNAAGCIEPIVDGSIIRELFKELDGSEKLFYAPHVVQTVRVFNPAANENAGPYIRNHETGYGMWAHLGGGNTMTLERLSPIDAVPSNERVGVIGVPVDPALIPTGAGESVDLTIEFMEKGAYGGADGWRISIDGQVVVPAAGSGEAWWRDTSGRDPEIRGPFETGRVFLREDTLNACGGQMAGTGFGVPPSASIESLAGPSAGVAALGQPLVVTWSDTEHSSSYSVIDSTGNVIGSYSASSTGANEDTIANLAITNARYGPLTIVADDNGMEASVSYPPPAGKRAVTFGAAIAIPSVTAQLQPFDQIEYDAATNTGDALELLASGHVRTTGGSPRPQTFNLRRHNGTSWGPPDEVYLFDAIAAVGSPPNQSHLADTDLSFDFEPFFNATKDLPPGEIGRSGAGLIIQLLDGGPDMSLSGFVATMLSPGVQTRTPTLRITDPAGGVALQSLTWSVTSAADVTPPTWDVVPAGPGVVTFDSFTVGLDASDAGSATVNLYLAATAPGDSPTAANIIAGVRSDGTTPLIARGESLSAASGDLTPVTAGGLSEGQTVSLFAVAQDESGNTVVQALGEHTTATRQPPAFDTPPSVVARTDNSITVRVAASDAESAAVDLYVAAAPQGDIPSDQNVIDNVQSDGTTPLPARAEQLAVPNGESRDLILTGLEQNTFYRIKVVAGDQDA